MRLTTLALVSFAFLAGCGTQQAAGVTSNLSTPPTSASLQAASTTNTVRPPLPLDLARSFAAWLGGSGIQLSGEQYTSAFEAARGAYVDALTAGATETQARAAATSAFEQFVMARI